MKRLIVLSLASVALLTTVVVPKIKSGKTNTSWNSCGASYEDNSSFATADYGTASVSLLNGFESSMVPKVGGITQIPTLSVSGSDPEKYSGFGPTALAYDSTRGRVMTANFDSSSVSVVDVKQKALVKNVSLPDKSYPYGVAYSKSKDQIYSANSFGDSISVIDAKTLEIIKNIQLEKSAYPYSLVTSPDGKRLYSVNRFSDSLSIINLDTLTSEGYISLPSGSKPTGLAISPDGNMVITANRGNDSISLIDLNTMQVTKTIDSKKGDGPRWVTINPYKMIAYTANQAGRTVTSYDLEKGTVLNTALLHDGAPDDKNANKDILPMSIDIVDSGKRLVVTSYNGNYLVRLSADDLSLQSAVQLPVGSHPYLGTVTSALSEPKKSCILHADTVALKTVNATAAKTTEVLPEICYVEGRGLLREPLNLYTTEAQTIEADFFDSKLLIKQSGTTSTVDLSVGTRPHDILLSSDSKLAYISKEGANTITSVDLATAKVIKNYPLPAFSGPRTIALSADNKSFITHTATDKYLITDVEAATTKTYTGSADIQYTDCETNSTGTYTSSIRSYDPSVSFVDKNNSLLKTVSVTDLKPYSPVITLKKIYKYDYRPFYLVGAATAVLAFRLVRTDRSQKPKAKL
jgi:YVTN family beta-propeller protein